MPTEDALTCAHGWPWLLCIFGGPLFECPDCAGANREAVERFSASVAGGKYDAQGYTRADRKAAGQGETGEC